MKLELAERLAARAILAMMPYCERIEVAGSVRRGKPHVGDLELVAIPKWEVHTETVNLLGEMAERRVNLLHGWAVASPIRWIKTNSSLMLDTTPKPEGRHWKAVLAQSGSVAFKLDLFLTTRERWGATFLLRTGDADFSTAVVTHAKQRTRYRFDEGALLLCGVAVETPEEADVFKRLGLSYLPPEERTGAAALDALLRGVK